MTYDSDGPSPVSAQRFKMLVLDDLVYRHRLIEIAIDQRERTIRHARDCGATWGEIGTALGMSRQAAHRRFGHLFNGDTAVRSASRRGQS